LSSASISKKRESRRLQVTGGSTYILSLPKDWIEERGLQKGSELALIRQNDGSLQVLAGESKRVQEPSEATIDIDPLDAPEVVARRIVSLYLAGYNVIYVRDKKQRMDSQQRGAIRDFIRRTLVGAEIVADSHSGLMIQVLLSYPELSVQSALRRMAAIASSMHSDSMTALKELDKKLADDIVSMDDEVDRFGLYLVRQLKAAVEDENVLSDIGLSTGRECLAYRLITKFVERTADHATEIARNVLVLKHPVEPGLLNKFTSMSASAISLFNEAVESLFKRNFQSAEKLVERAKKVAATKRELLQSVFAEIHPEEVSSLTLITESITRAAEYASDIAEIVLNLTVNQIIVANK